jgi:hypothetical protein
MTAFNTNILPSIDKSLINIFEKIIKQNPSIVLCFRYKYSNNQSSDFPNSILIVHSDESMHVRDLGVMLNKTVSFHIDEALNYYQVMITI